MVPAGLPAVEFSGDSLFRALDEVRRGWRSVAFSSTNSSEHGVLRRAAASRSKSSRSIVLAERDPGAASGRGACSGPGCARRAGRRRAAASSPRYRRAGPAVVGRTDTIGVIKRPEGQFSSRRWNLTVWGAKMKPLPAEREPSAGVRSPARSRACAASVCAARSARAGRKMSRKKGQDGNAGAVARCAMRRHRGREGSAVRDSLAAVRLRQKGGGSIPNPRAVRCGPAR